MKIYFNNYCALCGSLKITNLVAASGEHKFVLMNLNFTSLLSAPNTAAKSCLFNRSVTEKKFYGATPWCSKSRKSCCANSKIVPIKKPENQQTG